MSGCICLNAKFGCDHVNEWGAELCDEHKERGDWELCPRLQIKIAYTFERPCDYCRDKTNGILKDEFQLIMDAVRGRIENEVERDHDEAEDEDEEAAHEQIANRPKKRTKKKTTKKTSKKTKPGHDEAEEEDDGLPPGVVSSAGMGVEDTSGRGDKRQRE